MKINQYIVSVTVYLCVIIVYMIIKIVTVISYRNSREINNRMTNNNKGYNSCDINERNLDIENGNCAHKMYYQMEFVKK